MTCALATICLNEMQWLPRLYEQHKNWPNLTKWVFVESADIMYAKSNPHLVNDRGLSVDGTTEYLSELAKRDNRIVHIPYGFCGVNSKLPLDQHKCESRNVYLDHIESIAPDLLVIIDSDEFYTHEHQKLTADILPAFKYNNRTKKFTPHAFCFRQRHIWYPPYLQTKIGQLRYKEYQLFTHEVIKGYWDVVHCRVWKWEKGLRYTVNHNWPSDTQGTLLVHKGSGMFRYDSRATDTRVDTKSDLPQCIHLGYAANAQHRKAKCMYYEERGEGKEPNRQLQQRRKMYVECRNDYLSWEPGITLTHGARVIEYQGPIPEVFKDTKNVKE